MFVAEVEDQMSYDVTHKSEHATAEEAWRALAALVPCSRSAARMERLSEEDTVTVAHPDAARDPREHEHDLTTYTVYETFPAGVAVSG
jgi:hypothetical protein